nr:hypothetical protein [Tanacetum cinerariifolium]
KLKDTIMVAMPKLVGEGFYMRTIHANSSTTPIAEKIDKLERRILDGKLMSVDDDGKPLYKADSMVNVDSDNEVEEVFHEPIGFVASTSLKSDSESGYDTKSLLGE